MLAVYITLVAAYGVVAMSPVKAAVIAILSGVVALGAWGYWKWSTPKTVEFELAIVGPSTYEMKPERPELIPYAVPWSYKPRLKIFADGEEIAELRDSLRLITFRRTTRNTFRHPEGPSGYSARVLLPCGWKEVALTVETMGVTGTKEKAQGPKQLIGRLEAIKGQTVDLWVDNHNGKAMELALGEAKLQVAAGAKQKYEVAAPDCPAGESLRIEGEEVGKIPKALATTQRPFLSASLGEDPGPGGSWVFLLDPTGTRCYTITEKTYGKPGADYSGYAPGWSHSSYNKKKLHRLEPTSIDYFLEKAPSKIQSKYAPSPDGFSTLELVNEMLERPCG